MLYLGAYLPRFGGALGQVGKLYRAEGLHLDPNLYEWVRGRRSFFARGVQRGFLLVAKESRDSNLRRYNTGSQFWGSYCIILLLTRASGLGYWV